MEVFMNKMTRFIIIFSGLGFILLMILGCSPSRVIVEERPVYSPPPPPGPPPWAPAHGYRAKHRYYYYPESYVYFDIERKIYFYYQSSGWQVSVSLPSEIRIDLHNYVMLEMDTDRPYQFHSDVVKRYPPGKLKKFDEDNKGRKKR